MRLKRSKTHILKVVAASDNNGVRLWCCDPLWQSLTKLYLMAEIACGFIGNWLGTWIFTCSIALPCIIEVFWRLSSPTQEAVSV